MAHYPEISYHCQRTVTIRSASTTAYWPFRRVSTISSIVVCKYTNSFEFSASIQEREKRGKNFEYSLQTETECVKCVFQTIGRGGCEKDQTAMGSRPPKHYIAAFNARIRITIETKTVHRGRSNGLCRRESAIVVEFTRFNCGRKATSTTTITMPVR